MEDQIRNRIKELVAQRDQILGQINQNTTQRQQLEAAYQQTAGAIAGVWHILHVCFLRLFIARSPRPRANTMKSRALPLP